MSKKIIFFGNEKLATGVSTEALAFKSLINSGYNIAALIISQKSSKDTDKLEVVQLAKGAGIEVRTFSRLKDSLEEIKSYGAEAAILAAYGKIVPKDLINVFPKGIINIHPSLLPKHRGPTPIESVILNGETETGVSIMKLSADMDAGPIYAQKSLKITGKENKQELADMLDALGSELLMDNLEDILSGKLISSEQHTDGVTYDNLIIKEDGLLDFKENWQSIERKIRAFNNWPKVRFLLPNIQISIEAAHFVDKQNSAGKYIDFEGNLAIYCQDGLVVIDSLIPSGSNLMTGKAFLLGYSAKIFS
jgi:methionyl-tRNA formyltransferase